MKPKPVRKYAQPKYPTRLDIAAHPALLHKRYNAAYPVLSMIEDALSSEGKP
jgi:hypothetical protein